MEKPAPYACGALMCVAASVAELLFTSFTGKYVVELALGTSSRVHLAVICLLLIIGERITKYILNEASDYCGYYGNYKFACHMTRKIIRKNMSTDYENNESCDNGNAIQKAWVGSDYIYRIRPCTQCRNFCLRFCAFWLTAEYFQCLAPLCCLLSAFLQ